MSDLIGALIEACCRVVDSHADELTALDQAIGDGDHGINLRRGFGAIAEQREDLASLAPSAALQKAGMALVMKVGGASGPLYGSLLMAVGKAMAEPPRGAADLAHALGDGIEAVKKRGKSDVGAKTMLDVLVPVHDALSTASEAGGPPDAIIGAVRAQADAALAATGPMKATKGRAAFLGDRSIGHLDPGARSSALLIHAVCDVLEARS